MDRVKIFAKTVEPQALAQIEQMAAAPASEGSRIRIMPDCHAGTGCTIGTTMTIKDRICPNLVGVDIACGVMLALTDIDFAARLVELDAVIHKCVPAGRNIQFTPMSYDEALDIGLDKLRCWVEFTHETRQIAYRSLGTLGGGNHFIEAYQDGHICVHTGSRNIGLELPSITKIWRLREARNADDLTLPKSSHRNAKQR